MERIHAFRLFNDSFYNPDKYKTYSWKTFIEREISPPEGSQIEDINAINACPTTNDIIRFCLVTEIHKRLGLTLFDVLNCDLELFKMLETQVLKFIEDNKKIEDNITSGLG